jgi:hypothetical protein
VGLETEVTVHDGEDAPALFLDLRRALQPAPEGKVYWVGELMDEADFLDEIAREGRIVYEFKVLRAYGLE